jgi:hypothetical protein
MGSDDPAGRVRQWLAAIDAGGEPQARAARRELAEMGTKALDFVLQSLDEINAALLRQEEPEANMERLRRRVEVLAAMPDDRAVMPILRALVDSSVAVETLTAQLGEIHRAIERAGTAAGSMMMIAAVEGRREVAERLRNTAVWALAGFGVLALPHVERSLPRVPPCARRPLQAVRARILGQWWKFWLWGYGAAPSGGAAGQAQGAGRGLRRLFPLAWLGFALALFAAQAPAVVSLVREEVSVWGFLDAASGKIVLAFLFLAMGLTLFGFDLPQLPHRRFGPPAVPGPWGEQMMFNEFAAMSAHLVAGGVVLALDYAAYLLWGIMQAITGAGGDFFATTPAGRWLLVVSCTLPFLGLCLSLGNEPVTSQAATELSKEHGRLHAFLYYWGGPVFVLATGLVAGLVAATRTA